MPLFGTEAGLFMGGMVNQSNINRQLSVQEAGLQLQKTKLGIELDNSQKEQASKFIEEVVTIAAEIKKNFPGTSDAYARSKAAESVEILLSKADELAQQTGIPAVDYRVKIQSIPTMTDSALAEAQQDVAKAESKITAAGGDPQKEKALGVGKEGARFTNFRLPDGKIVAINLSDPKQVASLPPGSQVLTSFGVEAASADALTGQTPKDIREIRGKVEDLQGNIQFLEKTLTAFKETPEAGGIMGQLIETGGGILAQIPLVGDDILNAITDPEERAKVKEARTLARVAVSNMLETVTGEESGRFTDTERRIATEVLGALDVSASDEQIQTALSTVLDIMKDAQNRELNKLLTASGANLGSATGRQKFFDVLLKNSFSEDQAVDIIIDMGAR